MEPDRFEENIKIQLDKREIKPSADSWDKLQKKLEQKERGFSAHYRWTGIAAAIVGVMFLAEAFLNDSYSEGTPAVVETPSQEVIKNNRGGESNEEFTTAEKEEKKPASKGDAPVANKIRVLKKKVTKPDVVEKLKAKTRVADQTRTEEEPKLQKSQPLLAISDAPKHKTSGSVTDAEIEALLLEASRNIARDSAAYAAFDIDPDELLDQVEYELDQSFRQKVFEVLKEGFSKAKTAVANRNF